jgi:hypothetical protein
VCFAAPAVFTAMFALFLQKIRFSGLIAKQKIVSVLYDLLLMIFTLHNNWLSSQK